VQFFLSILHIVLSISLILIILLQPGKDQGAVFGGGGGGNKMYSPRGQANLLGRATTTVAVMFMFTSISLAWYSTEQVREGSNIDEVLDEVEDIEEGSGFGIGTGE
jgi:preprotein translocase subunit SecG